MPIVQPARHRAHAHDQVLQGRHGHRNLRAKLVRRPDLTLGKALDFGRVQRIQLVGALALLRVEPARNPELGLEGLGHGRGVALDAAYNRAQPGAQFLDLAPQALVLLGMGVAPGLLNGMLAYAGVALAKFDAGIPSSVDELLAGPVQQPTVGRVRDDLRLNRRVQHDVLKTAPLDDAGLRRRFDGVRQQPLATFLSDALAPAHQARRVARQFKAEVARRSAPPIERVHVAG